jgi:Aspartyl protease
VGIASDTRKLDPPLKGNNICNNNNNNSNSNNNINDKGGGDSSITSSININSSSSIDGGGDLSGVRWRVGRVTRRIDSERRLVILRGYARAEDGRLHPVQIRAMIDSGAQTEFISPDLARRLGGKITEGQFGVAVEAFGGETPLTKQARNIELRLPGTNPRSLLSQDFLTRWDFIVSPHSLSTDYDLLLGTRFIRRFRLNLTFHEPCVIRLTAENGSETMLTEELEEQEEHIEQERQPPSLQFNGAALMRTQEPAARRPPTQSQRRAICREWRESEEW